jgi:hypothetical protein
LDCEVLQADFTCGKNSKAKIILRKSLNTFIGNQSKAWKCLHPTALQSFLKAIFDILSNIQKFKAGIGGKTVSQKSPYSALFPVLLKALT